MRILAGLIKTVTVTFTLGVILAAGMLFVPRFLGFVPFVVQSGSMEPAIKTGSIVFVDSKAKEPSVGDIIAFRAADGTVILHRAVTFDPEEGIYITKGDANSTIDAASVRQDAVVGTYALHMPGGYALAKFEARTIQFGGMKLPAMSLVIIGLVVALNTIDAVLDSRKMRKN